MMKKQTSFLFVLLATPAAAFAPTPLISGITKAARSPSSLQATSSSSSPLEAILFDCDGVLADTERDGHRLAFNIAFQNSGIDEEWSEERYGKLLEVGGGKERMTAHWNEVGWPSQIRDAKRSNKIMGLHLQKTEIFMQLIDDGKIPLRPGVLRIIDEAISNGVRLAVCSTSNEKAVSNLVSTLMGRERADQFQIFAGDMVKEKKPAPDVYLMAVEEMGLDKDRCVIIEDSHIGVGAAVAAGISCLVTKSSYTGEEDFTGAKMIVDELGDDAGSGVTLATLSCLLGDDSAEEAPATTSSSWDPYQASGPRGIGVSMEAHIEKGGASWTGARFGDENVNKPHRYTASETHEASSPRGIGVKMEAHVESGGASWTGARFGNDDAKVSRAYTASETYEASSPRGIGVKMEAHIEKGGASWTGARFGDDNSNDGSRQYTASETFAASSPRGIGVKMEAHVERGGASWTGARFGDDNSNDGSREYTASETYAASSPRGIGVKMEAHVERGGASWTGARFGDDNSNDGSREYTASETYEAYSPRGIGVKMEAHVERGGASWTGARFGDDDSNNASHAYTPSETYESKSKSKSSGAEWDGVAHTDIAPLGTDENAWSGARFGDRDARRCGATPSQWHE